MANLKSEIIKRKFSLPAVQKKKYVIIVAGGSGKRMGGKLPKQFLLLNGKPLLMHTLSLFRRSVKSAELILVLPGEYIAYWKKLCKKFSFSVPHTIVEGGATRFHSVKNGLLFTSGNGIVAVHDGVRPLVSEKLISEAFRTARKKGSAVPAVAPSESVRVIKDGKSFPADRSGVRLVQTPQCFSISKLKNAYQLPFRKLFTDDASVFEASGNRVHLVEGEKRNIKITTREDLATAARLLKNNR
jgi:2-C-methyl-D-erythritol 4-phosphate cytidylyltransferase